MSGFHFANPAGLAAALAIPLFWFGFRRGDRGGAAAMAAWNGAALPARTRRERVRRALICAAVPALALALARPSWHTPQAAPARPGDVVFLLDVSRSMLSADASPSRLARAKANARLLAAEARGQRVALVAFAGGQSIECPLTVDHEFFLEMLEGASRESVPRGGTSLGDAIRFTLRQVFDDVLRGRRTIVLLTDGGDPGPDAAAAAREAEDRGIGVVAVGVGDEREGALVPVSASDPTPMLYQGRPVRTRLNLATLREVAGAAVLRDGGSDSGEAYRRWMSPAGSPRGQPESDETGWMVWIAVAAILLAVEPRLGGRRERAAAALLLALLARPPAIFAQTIEEWFGKGLEALRDHQSRDAIHYFGDASRWAPGVPEIRFNLGVALYQFQAYFEANLAFDQAAGLSHDREFQARSRLGQGNALFRDADLLARAQPGQAIERLEQCIAAYREALRLDGQVLHAAYNLQVAEHRLQQLRDRGVATPREQAEPLPAASPQEVLDQAPRAVAPGRGPLGAAVERDW